MESKGLEILIVLILGFLFTGCASFPERIDGSPFDQAQYDEDEMFCRSQVSKRYPIIARQKAFAGTPSRTPDTIPKTDPLPFAAMEFSSCMKERGWKKF